MQIPSLSRLAVPSLLVAALVAPAIALADSSDRPFTAEIATHEIVGPVPGSVCLPSYSGVATGRGVASHLGAVSLQANDCVTPVPLPTAPYLTFAFSRGSFVLTAASGEKLNARYADSMLQPTATPGVYAIASRYVVEGGSGRFSRATGQGTLNGFVNVVTGDGSYSLSGRISY